MNLIKVIKENGDFYFIDNYPNLNVIFSGINSVITLYEGTKFQNCRLNVFSNTKIEIGKSRETIVKLCIWAADNSEISIGQNFSCWGVEIRGHEKGSKVNIGSNCMFSEEILLYPTDVHSIYDINTMNVVNETELIDIGDNVWCGRRVVFLKGSSVGSHSVVGISSVVTKKFIKSNCVIAGNPARITRENIAWDRKPPSVLKKILNEN